MSEVIELTDTESGRWCVYTQASRHIIDFDRRTVERIPGPDTFHSPRDAPQPLRGILACRIGVRLRYTMDPEYGVFGLYTRHCGVPHTIEQILDGGYGTDLHRRAATEIDRPDVAPESADEGDRR